MGIINVTAAAGADSIRRVVSGELEISGIILHDSDGKKFRYILRGLEHVAEQVQNGDSSPLEPLRAIMSVTQIINPVGIAQNAALAATLKRVEGKLHIVDRQLTDVINRLSHLEAKAELLLHGMRSAPLTRLRAAHDHATQAYRLGDQTALFAAAKDFQRAALDIQAQAVHLTRIEQNGIPLALLAPHELGMLTSSGAEAMAIAASTHTAADMSTPVEN